MTMSQVWSSFDMVRQEFLSTESPLVVLTEVHARAAATGRALDFSILQMVTIEGGVITEVRPFYWDSAAIAAACN